ncbi:hypothetical protein D3C87_1981050 [compost metagenome]
MTHGFLDVLLELSDSWQLSIIGVDVKIRFLAGALVEWHLIETFVHQLHTFQNRLSGVIQIGRECRKILMTLITQEIEEVLLIRG